MYETGEVRTKESVAIYEVLGSWHCASVNWNTCPEFASGFSANLDSASTSGVKGNKVSLDITEWVQRIAMGGENYGLMCKAAYESTSNSYTEFYGSRSPETEYRPRLIVYYDDSGCDCR